MTFSRLSQERIIVPWRITQIIINAAKKTKQLYIWYHVQSRKPPEVIAISQILFPKYIYKIMLGYG